MSRTRYRADQIEDLMNRVRTQHERWEAEDRAQQTDADGFERTTTSRARRQKRADGPAHRYDEARLKAAWDQNLHAANYAPSDGEMFGRRGKMRYRVLKPGGQSDARMPPSGPFGQASLPPPKHAPSRTESPVPTWMRLQLSLDRAYEALEVARRAALEPLRRGAVAQMGKAGPRGATSEVVPPPESTSKEPPPGVVATERGQDRYVKDRPGPPTRIEAEATHADFEYDLAESAFWQYAAGAEVIAGQGADFFDPEGTRTFIFGRPV